MLFYSSNVPEGQKDRKPSLDPNLFGIFSTNTFINEKRSTHWYKFYFVLFFPPRNLAS